MKGQSKRVQPQSRSSRPGK